LIDATSSDSSFVIDAQPLALHAEANPSPSQDVVVTPSPAETNPALTEDGNMTPSSAAVHVMRDPIPLHATPYQLQTRESRILNDVFMSQNS
jgi:hypothetical protein